MTARSQEANTLYRAERGSLAHTVRYEPNIKWGKKCGKEPERPKDEYPWFWNWDEKTIDFTGGKTFDGNRWNDLHYTNDVKRKARESREKQA